MLIKSFHYLHFSQCIFTAYRKAKLADQKRITLFSLGGYVMAEPTKLPVKTERSSARSAKTWRPFESLHRPRAISSPLSAKENLLFGQN